MTGLSSFKSSNEVLVNISYACGESVIEWLEHSALAKKMAGSNLSGHMTETHSSSKRALNPF